MFWVRHQEEHPDSSAVHATFNQLVGQLTAASEGYQQEGTAFLCGLLQPDPTKRMTAQEALHHPFFTRTFPEVPPGLLPVVVQEARGGDVGGITS
jgi:hypothetical protein